MEPIKLFSIGDVAKLFHLSVSSLRHYEAAGLLQPEWVDPQTGYRYYSTRQFEVLNTIRYLRALDMPLPEIADFLRDRDVGRMEEKLRLQRETVIRKQQELRRIERKIENRLQQLHTAQTCPLDTVELVEAAACRIVWMESSMKIEGYLDMETWIRKLDSSDVEAVVFLGKVGVSLSGEHLRQGRYTPYDGIFLVLDEEDNYNGEVQQLPQALCVRIRFRGSHAQAPEQYEKLTAYIAAHQMEVAGFSREITMIDYGLTNDLQKFVTEISIPARMQ
jgi:DNA-binding transcriptional MerR regulator/effector-binding domain-containing protein